MMSGVKLVKQMAANQENDGGGKRSTKLSTAAATAANDDDSSSARLATGDEFVLRMRSTIWKLGNDDEQSWIKDHETSENLIVICLLLEREIVSIGSIG